MPIIELKNVSKIYTTKDNVEVGISNINLMLDKDEVVAITGKSGAGKSTLLRVLGGLESYEKGELYFKGNPTSSYSKEDWDNYLKENISFIFQEYNILESFTVLENVEFALTKIKNRAIRKQKAIEIIERVGLKDRIKSKGSQLSGGEKQRTVIARAIAKDSPIILADEPTGNLDSKTAKEILSLLKEISKGKLLVIVTHNYDDVKDFATRHIRVFDGKIESDDQEYKEELSSYKKDDYDFKDEHAYIFKKKTKKVKHKGEAKCNFIDSMAIGLKRYTSRPKQTILMTMLFVAVVIILFLINIGLASSSYIGQDFDDAYLGAVPQDNRVILIKEDNSGITVSELKALKQEFNATNYVLGDNILDLAKSFTIGNDSGFGWDNYIKVGTNTNMKVDVGRNVENDGEITIRIPYTYKSAIPLNTKIKVVRNLGNKQGFEFKVVGIDYVFGERGVVGEISNKDAEIYPFLATNLVVNPVENEVIETSSKLDIDIDYNLTGKDAYIAKSYYSEQNYLNKTFIITNNGIEQELDVNLLEVKDAEGNSSSQDTIFVSKDFYYNNLVNKDTNKGPQGALYFSSQEDAEMVAKELNLKGYKALASSNFIKLKNQTKVRDSSLIILISLAIGVILAFSLTKVINSTKEDLFIFRTMGIEDNVVKGSSFLHMLLCTIPSIILLIIMYLIIFATSLGQGIHFVKYEVIIATSIALLLTSALVAYLYNRILYSKKVNKGLRRTNK